MGAFTYEPFKFNYFNNFKMICLPFWSVALSTQTVLQLNHKIILIGKEHQHSQAFLLGFTDFPNVQFLTISSWLRHKRSSDQICFLIGSLHL